MHVVRMTVAAALATGMLFVAPGGPAGACACGGIVSHDQDARGTGEQALIATHGGTETIVMRLDLESVADNAALIIPTPTPATATQAKPALFDELARLSAPRVRPGRNNTDLDEVAAAPGAAPVVVAQVQLGPLEATTLTGGDLAGVRQWLDSHGYRLRPEVSAQLDPYLRQGWSFVAMRLTGEKPLSGQIDPVKLQFASDRLVYPMRMSAAAKNPQRVVIYALGEHRMQRTDADAGRQNVAVDFAGSIAGRTTDETLTELSAANPYLTRITTAIPDPASITDDFTFGPAPSDEPFQQVIGGPSESDDTPVWVPVAATVAVIAVLAATGQGSVIHTGGSTAANGDVAAGSHGGSLITGSQGSAHAGSANSVGSSHASTNVDQHAAVESSTHAVTGTPDHSAFDPSAHIAADSSSHSLFDAGHDPSASHIPQFGAEAATHNQFDQHLGF